MQRTYKTQDACPVARSLDVIGDGWTVLVLRDLAYVEQGILRRDLRTAGIVAEKDDLVLAPEPPPTFNGVGLNELDMPGKCLGYREDAQHRSPMPF